MSTKPKTDLEEKLKTKQVSTLDEVAETIREDALDEAFYKLGVLRRGLDMEDLLLRVDFVENFKYSIAKGVAHALSAHDERVLEVYVFDPHANPDVESGAEPGLDGTVHQLVIVERPSAALDSFIASLDRALTKSLKGLPSTLFSKRDWVLDLHLVTEKEVEEKIGYGRWISAMFSPPIKIWERGG
jgi:hypothetical protein